MPALAQRKVTTDVGTLDRGSAEKAFQKPPYSPYAGRNFPTRPFFGETHLHTSFSMDARAYGARLGPKDAYRLPKGEEIRASSGQLVKLSRSLDFLVVADHSDNMGFFPDLFAGDLKVLVDATGRRWCDMVQSGKGADAAIFVVYSLASELAMGKPGHITITQGKIGNLAATSVRIWQCPPTDQELEGLIQDYIREEVFYREALALGLERDDTVIRRRLRQKMEFVAEDFAAQAEPSDDQSRAYLQAHPEGFAIESRFSFRQVYLDPQRRGAKLARDVDRLLAELHQAHGNADLTALGDAFLLAQEFENASATDVRKSLGEPFAAGLSARMPGQWQGSVPSGYGVHLV